MTRRPNRFPTTVEAVQKWAVTAKMLGEEPNAIDTYVSISIPVLQSLVESAREWMGAIMKAADPDAEITPELIAIRQRMFAGVVSGEKALYAAGIHPREDEAWIWRPLPNREESN